MASNSFGRLLRMTTFGESHGPALGVVIDGVPARLPLTVDDFVPELRRRRPGQSDVTTARREEDAPVLLSGVFEGLTTGAPITVIVENHGQRSQDYDALRDVVRAGHADETYAGKYGHRDHRGGGRSSGRETIGRVVAGVVARRILPPTTRVIAHAKQIGPHRASRFEPETIESNPVRCADPDVAERMTAFVRERRDAHDSVGGLVECRVLEPPPHVGDPVFAKLKARLADAVMSVGAVTGFSYGAGFATAEMGGRDYVADREHFGGILGGISTGETLVVTASVKPTTSRGMLAKTGRHDPCIVPRIVPVIEAMVAFTLADALLEHRALGGE